MADEPDIDAAIPEQGYKAAFPLAGAAIGLALLLVVIGVVGGVMMMMP